MDERKTFNPSGRRIIDPRVTRAVEIINQFFPDRPSEKAIARRVNLSAARLRQLFKKEMGISLTQYVRRLRMKKAAMLLQESFLSVKEIVFESGGKDISHFVRDFKKEFGVSPSAFREQAHQAVKRNNLVIRA